MVSPSFLLSVALLVFMVTSRCLQCKLPIFYVSRGDILLNNFTKTVVMPNASRIEDLARLWYCDERVLKINLYGTWSKVTRRYSNVNLNCDGIFLQCFQRAPVEKRFKPKGHGKIVLCLFRLYPIGLKYVTLPWLYLSRMLRRCRSVIWLARWRFWGIGLFSDYWRSPFKPTVLSK
jgi:hypothetical protein